MIIKKVFKKENFKKMFLFSLILFIFIISVSSIFADVGNHTDYYKDNKSYSKNNSGGSGANIILNIISFLLGTVGFVGVFIFLIIGLIIYCFIKKSGSLEKVKDIKNSIEKEFSTDTKDNTFEIESKLKEHDELFSTTKFIAWSKEVFITLQNAWSERDWSKVRPFENEELYKLHEIQLKEYINKGRVNKLEEINVNKAFLAVYKQSEEYEYLTVHMQVRMIDYIVDESTEKVINGNPNIPVRNNYLLTFMRKIGVLTDPAKSNMSTNRCPNCGAPTQITSAGQCEYCNFIVTTGEHDWVLTNIENI